MYISVLISTRNRAASLRRTLDSLLVPSNLQAKDWELLVVDNGSTDETPTVSEEFAKQFPGLMRALVEKRAGKSLALNQAIAAARGDILALTDDDVLCAPDYIEAVRRTFSAHPADGAQGRILLDIEGGRPVWMNDFLEGIMSLRDYGAEVFEWNDNLSGCNMVVRAEVFRKVGGFSPELGAGAIGFMEDSEFSLRMRGAGFRLIYAPEILVRHQLSRERLNKSMIVKNCFKKGRAEAYIVPLPSPLWRFGLYAMKQFAVKQARAIGHALSGRPDAAMYDLCERNQLLGFFWQHWKFSRGVSRNLSPRYFGGPGTAPHF
jgi:glucosyl-dolichyl phosphate glucuronosyltransferase